MKVFITYKIPDAGIKMLQKKFKIEVYQGEKFLTKKEMMEKVKNVDAVITQLRDPVDREFIDAGKNLKIIANYAVGYNNIDVEYAKKKGIYVTNTPDVLTEATADIAWALILAVARKIIPADKFVREGKFEGWKPHLFLGHEIYGKTIGIIGMGRIGKAVARRAMGFGMKILYHNRKKVDDDYKYNAKYVELETLLKESDYISIHTPLTKETYHLLDSEKLSLLKPTSILINTARGPVVDEKALYEFLREGKIAGAGFDVYENEPKLTSGLEKLDNVVLLPHIGSATYETREKMSIMVAENVIDALEGKIPRNLVWGND
ncbi:glyoxylate reductase [Thermosipho melanesiensis]|uniref:D-isomer specific 2-hydroxyacid dehydrogenase, NAD-binding n=2 Tax=Thermosipho melanesiensis TaxID=46541 RepID=A6LLF2_THEM4|nr:D-glycerate dehydrogenase [Thermosipho melanesiensis]ABR30753.1 D-isomer specific 2-hydroxyacid dehydrogenase, NAD-binding [Thermosipho melanesiensis BI429]APT73876.1 glyoxylate reductase [Thermosipho melanesiensis]OOC35817.1 glyoxylate reductase [Thermosipho melanesiensis]OOC38319.1 glyoxylate reductase [Thermosipho melanesiensis]OOC38780.1 glyoxylate reductase [Thermosipho melanesiensis]